MDSLEAGEYLTKPVLRDDLLGTLDQLGLAGQTILIVDDEPEALQLFWRMLASSDSEYHVLLAADGREGLDILREQHPDAVLLDLIMPDMDGFQFLAAIRADAALCDTPVVVVSARDPVGHPVVANTVAIAQKGGLSVPQLLSLAETVIGPLAVRDRSANPVADPEPTKVPLG
jgi:CheY-like chemotaxis protein